MHRDPLDPIDDLRPELAALDAELTAIHIAERASFAPELHAELHREAEPAGEWIRPTTPGRWGIVAASAAAVLVMVALPLASVGSVSVMMARLESVLPALGSPEPVVPVVPDGNPVTPPAQASLSTVGSAEAINPFRPVRMVLPRPIDAEETKNAIRRLYPRSLQRAGIGGIVNVQFHVDSTGVVVEALVLQGSGFADLDRAALDAAPLMRFQPATWDGRPFSTWVEFNIVFEPSVDGVTAALDDVSDAESIVPTYETIGSGLSPIRQETLELLQAALADSALADRLGGIGGLAHGEPPLGADPFAWRERAGQALESATRKAPDNPAPFLALARIRRKQGLPDEARNLLEQGIRRAERGGITVSPRLTAELRYELAGAARESWSAWDHLGRLPATALDPSTCARARTVFANDEVTPETLIAWNYVCPEELRRILDAHFQEAAPPSQEHEQMLSSLRAAVANDPAHVGANVDLLLDVAERGDDAALLNGARRFALETSGHPYARLLIGLALEDMGRPEEAYAQLQTGLAGLPSEEADHIRDIRPLLDPDAVQRFAGLSPAVRAQAEEDFWRGQDPLRSTEVNEGLVAHLARSVYAYFRFGGSETDAGSVWVRYGPPTRIRSVGEGTALRTELWDYGTGPAVTFRRPAASTTLDLTPEGRAYLADLRTTRPRDYGRGGRVIDRLDAEVARFRDASGSPELDIAAHIPQSLRLAEEPISFSLIQLDARGNQVEAETQKVTPTQAVIRAGVSLDPATREVAVEMLGSAVNRAAAMRVPVPARRPSGPTISDLQLVRAAVRPRREVPRSADQFEPLGDHTVAAPDVGVVFELYDLPNDQPYRLKVEIEKAGSRPEPVRFRPSGQTQWLGSPNSRRPWPDAHHSTEVLGVRLSDVGPGQYTLRVTATLADGTTLTSEHPLDRK